MPETIECQFKGALSRGNNSLGEDTALILTTEEGKAYTLRFHGEPPFITALVHPELIGKEVAVKAEVGKRAYLYADLSECKVIEQAVAMTAGNTGNTNEPMRENLKSNGGRSVQIGHLVPQS